MAWFEALKRYIDRAVPPILRAPIHVVASHIAGQLGEHRGWISSLARTVGELRGEIWNVLRPGAESLGREIAKIWDEINRIIIPDIDALRDWIEEVHRKVWDYVIPDIDLLWDSIREIWDKLRVYRIPELWRKLGDLRAYFDGKISWLSDLIKARYRDLGTRIGILRMYIDRRVDRLYGVIKNTHRSLELYIDRRVSVIWDELVRSARRITAIESFLAPEAFWPMIDRGTAGHVRDKTAHTHRALRWLDGILSGELADDLERDYDVERMEPIKPFVSPLAKLLNRPVEVD